MHTHVLGVQAKGGMVLGVQARGGMAWGRGADLVGVGICPLPDWGCCSTQPSYDRRHSFFGRLFWVFRV